MTALLGLIGFVSLALWFLVLMGGGLNPSVKEIGGFTAWGIASVALIAICLPA